MSIAEPKPLLTSLGYAEAKLTFNSVETIPSLNASAAFQVDSGKVFKEDVDIVPTIIDDTLSYMPWGGDNAMPYNILKLIEDDETLSTCQMFNAEVCYGSGLEYNTDECSAMNIKEFYEDNIGRSFTGIISNAIKTSGETIDIARIVVPLQTEIAAPKSSRLNVGLVCVETD